MSNRDPKQRQDGRDALASHQSSDETVNRTGAGASASEAGQTDEEARQDPAQTHFLRGEAQNVSDPQDGPRMEDGSPEADHARNKAMEGQKQNRDQ